MVRQTIITLYDWEASRIAGEIRSTGITVKQEGRTLALTDLKSALERQHVRAICDAVSVKHAWLDGVPVFV